MATNREVEGVNPIQGDAGTTDSGSPDVKKYHRLGIESTKHYFYAPIDKYKDLLTTLGLKDIDNDDTAANDKYQKLAQGEGYVHVKARTKGGANFLLVCDPAKLQSALNEGHKKKVYGADIQRVYLPKRRVLI